MENEVNDEAKKVKEVEILKQKLEKFLKGMNRQQRRKWLRQNKHLVTKA